LVSAERVLLRRVFNLYRLPARNYIELVEKTMRVLEVLAQHPGGCALKEIAARTGLVKSSAFRILHSLKELGYVEQAGPEARYHSSLKVLSLARAVATHEVVINVARPHLQNLRETLGESAWLGQRFRDGVLLVDSVEAPRRLRLSLDIGDSCPWHAAAIGKSIAAFLSPEELDLLLGTAPLPRFTPRTLTDRRRLQAHLAQVRRQGFAVNEEETIETAVVVGAPIFDALHHVCAAVSVGTVATRWKGKFRDTMAAAVQREAANISRKLSQLSYRAPR
jgi:IclR family acetate operon transcriptional repressor